MISLQPLSDNILVKLRNLPEATGAIIRVARDEVSRTADVLAVGPEVRDVAVGTAVVINILTAHECGANHLLPESGVLAFLDEH